MPRALYRAGAVRRPDVVGVNFTLGFGNNLFQYIAARLLAEELGLPLRANRVQGGSTIAEFAKLGIEIEVEPSRFFGLGVGDDTYARALADLAAGDRHRILVTGFFEDYRHYLPHLDRIRSWFRPVERQSERDLALHFRTGDRLFMREEFYEKPRVEDYLAAIEQFEFDRLHIVSDLPGWKTYSEDELRQLTFHRSIPDDESVPIAESVRYLNEFIEGLSRYNLVFRSTSPAEDFDYLRSFDQILFEHGTLSWWAAVLGGASRVGVYGPWRPWRGESNRNLSEVPLPGWFQWDRLQEPQLAAPIAGR